jgi:hypothetical protein
MSNALYLDEICTHLTLQGYLYPLRATLYGYPGMTDTYDLHSFSPHSSRRYLFYPSHNF